MQERLQLATFVRGALLVLALLGCPSVIAAAESAQACGPGSVASGKVYAVEPGEHPLRVRPDAKAPKVVNEKATAILKTTQYAKIDQSTMVRQNCTQGSWSHVSVTEPEWLRATFIGWTPTKALRIQERDAGGSVVYTEKDFSFDKKTAPHKKTIIKGVNKVARENEKCKKLDPSSVYISSSKGSASDPVFYVTCGEGAGVFNAFFSKSDVEGGKQLAAVKHVNRDAAIDQCEAHAKSQATHPSTVKFSRVMDLGVRETPNGNTEVTSTFKAKNSFNLELKFKIRCLSNAAGLFEPTVWEATD